MAALIFDHAHPEVIEIIFSFPKFAPASKISVHSVYSLLRILGSHHQLPMPIMDLAYLKKFDQLLVYVNLYQHAKNQAILEICLIIPAI